MTHFLDIADFDRQTLTMMLIDASEVKVDRSASATRLDGKAVAMIFETQSTRTRISFEVGIKQLGAQPIALKSEDMQLGRGETFADTAKVLSLYVDAIVIRARSHATLVELADNAYIPVINGLTDRSHPCQVMGDMLTLAEHKAPDYDFSGLKIVWLGDSNNVATSWLEAAGKFGFEFILATPQALLLDADSVAKAQNQGAKIIFEDKAITAAVDADVIVTDTWASMAGGGGRSNSGDNAALLHQYQVTEAVMKVAKSDAVFMHCLPVYRGQEVVAEVVDGAQSIIWDEAENRLHVQKSILSYCANVMP